jgi:hypothetical protein
VQFRWMYSQERELKKFRATVRNKVRVEGCIAEAFTCKEITKFSSMYFSRANNMDDFGMVEVKHESRYSGSNLLFAHQAQQVYYLSYPHPSLKIGEWCIKLILKCILLDMMSTWKDTRMMMSLMSIKKKLKDTRDSQYLTGQDSQN